MQRNITMLNDLPDLEELENLPHEQNFVDSRMGLSSDQQRKFIRGNHTLNSESGMTEQEYHQQYIQQPQREIKQEMYTPPIQEPFMYNCLDISKHVQVCPICTRFYNNDKSVYIFCIVCLVILCLLLLKKVLNV